MLVVPRHIWGTTSNKPHISCRFCQLRAPTGPNANLCNSCQCLEIPTCYKHPLGEARGSLILPSFLTASLGCLFLHAPCRARFSCQQSLGNSAQVPDFLKKASPSVPWTLSTNSVSTSGHLALSYSTWKKAVAMHMFSHQENTGLLQMSSEHEFSLQVMPIPGACPNTLKINLSQECWRGHL